MMENHKLDWMRRQVALKADDIINRFKQKSIRFGNLKKKFLKNQFKINNRLLKATSLLSLFDSNLRYLRVISIIVAHGET